MPHNTVDPFDGSFVWFDTSIIHLPCGTTDAIDDEYDEGEAIDWIYDHSPECPALEKKF
jgi:hypothetical protein